MPKTITCPRCGASALSRRISKDTINTDYGNEFIFCTEMDERFKAGEDSIPKGECKTFDRAIQDAIDQGKL
jgi:hypothetical protein